MVGTNRIRLDAKIGGMTPAMFSFSGRCVPATVHLVANLPLGIVHQDFAQCTLEEHYRSSNHDDQGDQGTGVSGCQIARDCSSSVFQRSWQPVAIPAKDQQRNTITKTAFGDLLAQPHQEHRARHQRDRRDEDGMRCPDP